MSVIQNDAPPVGSNATGSPGSDAGDGAADEELDGTMPIWHRVRSFLPTGARIDHDSFVARHLVAKLTVAVMLVVLTVVGLVNGDGILHVLFELLPVAIPGVLAHLARNRLVAILAASWALMACASVLVHQTEGLIEAHFLYFVLLPLVALYQDWRAFLGSIGYVLVSHTIVGVIRPESMYNHPAALASPIKWAGVHALFVAALVVILIIEWGFAEAEQRRSRLATEDLQSTQIQLLQAQKMESIGQLAAGVAHEINTPVQYVSDNTSFLAESFDELTVALEELTALAKAHDSDKADEILAAADLEFLQEEIPGALSQSKDGLKHVSEIVKAMKDFAHPGSEVADAFLNKVITSTATVSRNEWKYVADLEFDLDESLPPVQCNEGQIKQVILNMIVNAAHAIAEVVGEGDKGTITIRSSVAGDHAVVEIRDTGSGMPPEVKDRIFEQFFTTKGVGRGTGQGLAMAHDIIVNAHRGEIEVESTVGEGTSFRLLIPIRRADLDD